MKYLLAYDLAPGGLALARQHLAGHRARLQAFHGQGTLLLAGPLMDEEGGALGVFTTRASAEEFALEDPFVLHGVVGRWRVREWNEILA